MRRVSADGGADLALSKMGTGNPALGRQPMDAVLMFTTPALSVHYNL